MLRLDALIEKIYLVLKENRTMIAYILINTEVGDEEKVYEVLLNMKGVLEAHIVYGVYDIIAKVQSESMDGLREVVSEIRKKAGLKSTLTLIVTR